MVILYVTVLNVIQNIQSNLTYNYTSLYSLHIGPEPQKDCTAFAPTKPVLIREKK